MLSQTNAVCSFTLYSFQIRSNITHQPRLREPRGLVSWYFLIEILYSFLISAGGTNTAKHILIDINNSGWRAEILKIFVFGFFILLLLFSCS
jgi:hypothetical protein